MKRYKTETTCEYCQKTYKKETYDFKRTKHDFCSKQCAGLARDKQLHTNCEICGKPTTVKQKDVKKSKSGKFFCSRSCAAIFNNKLKRKSRRSKIEAKFYDLLVKEFPELDILSNDKTMLDGYEVDIAVPSIQLAIEWNGIVHFKPIYGQTKLDNIQNRDADKLKIAANKDINLIVISDLVSNDKILKQAFDDVKVIIKNLTG